ncbi:MAG: hypothetical protein U0228_05490 [Myxococcaceae bacterium]
MSDKFPVFVSVAREDGRTEQVRIGSAVRSGEGFTLSFDTLTIGGTPAPAPAARSAPARASSGGGAPPRDSGMVFPPYGRSKGLPVTGASMGDLEFYANGCRRTLSDPGKARWHDKERALLSAIEAEIARQRGGGGGGGDDDGPPPPGDHDAPPDGDDPF